MVGLKLIVGNRMEILMNAMGRIVQEPLASPFEKEIIVTQSKGMEQWVHIKLAEQLGVSANISFLHPNKLLTHIYRLIVDPTGTAPIPFDKEFLTWKLMNILPEQRGKKEFNEINHYLSEKHPLKLYQLCQRIAEVFNRYTVFRSDMIHDWENNQHDGGWQSILWREIIKENQRSHYASLRQEIFEKLKQGSELSLPQRIIVFGVSALPPFHLEFLKVLSDYTNLYLFLVNPCCEYWLDIVSEKDIARISKKGNYAISEEMLHLDVGNNLLASMGKVGRDLFYICEDLDFEKEEFFVNPGNTLILSSIQEDILNLKDETENKERRVTEGDKSLQVHSTHSKMREIEVLYDNLLNIFSSSPDITPRDVLVMTPDIEGYTPYIKAIFDNPEHERKRIPYSITDRSVMHENYLVNTFFTLLDIAQSRFEAGRVLDFLSLPIVMRSFNLQEENLETIEHWVKSTEIRWGMNEKHRSDINVPPFEQNSWDAGFKRLFAGYALPDTGEFFEKTLPFGDIEGSDGEILGNFMNFYQALKLLSSDIKHDRTLREWQNFLNRALEKFFLPLDEEERAFLDIKKSINNLGQIEVKCGYNHQTAIELITSYLKNTLESERSEGGFITGRATFAAMLPMRCIPYRVVCLCGMNEGVFPKNIKPLSFDLIGTTPRLGDRSVTHEDRYLFLEALLSARDYFLISYTGRNIKDNTEKPPSILVSELLDYVRNNFSIDTTSIYYKHPLQSFSHRYFSGEKNLYSYSHQSYKAAVANCGQKSIKSPFYHQFNTLSFPEGETIDIKPFCSFFSNPVKYFFNNRLEMYFERGGESLPESEPFVIDGLEKYLISNDLIKQWDNGEDTKKVFERYRAEGKIPYGKVGDVLFNKIHVETEKQCQRLLSLTSEGKKLPVEIDREINGLRVTGKLENIYSSGLIFSRPATLKAKDRINAWICHLLLNTEGKEPMQTVIAGSDGAFYYLPETVDAETVKNLFELYKLGQTRPLFFFPETSFSYAEAIFKEKNEKEAMEMAQKKWKSDKYRMGEQQDPYNQKFSEGIDIFTKKEFTDLSQTVFTPMLQSQQKLFFLTS
ncbi:MAG: exodeoxyribonuclease V subunit gamma [Nitrospinae bacterium]|nr:exodeoxyribonuclease V subunit gamma [Nitrospinota bacterium]